VGNYLAAIAIFLLVLFPLFPPVAVTLAPIMSSGVRRIGRTFGLRRRAPQSA
jgi:hypothetical protein